MLPSEWNLFSESGPSKHNHQIVGGKFEYVRGRTNAIIASSNLGNSSAHFGFPFSQVLLRSETLWLNGRAHLRTQKPFIQHNWTLLSSTTNLLSRIQRLYLHRINSAIFEYTRGSQVVCNEDLGCSSGALGSGRSSSRL